MGDGSGEEIEELVSNELYLASLEFSRHSVPPEYRLDRRGNLRRDDRLVSNPATLE